MDVIEADLLVYMEAGEVTEEVKKVDQQQDERSERVNDDDNDIRGCCRGGRQSGRLGHQGDKEGGLGSFGFLYLSSKNQTDHTTTQNR